MLSIVRKQADIRHTGAGSSRDLIVPEVEIGLEFEVGLFYVMVVLTF